MRWIKSKIDLAIIAAALTVVALDMILPSWATWLFDEALLLILLISLRTTHRLWNTP